MDEGTDLRDTCELKSLELSNWLEVELEGEASLISQLVSEISACNAGDPSSIPESERSPEGIDYPLQYSWASLLAPMVKNPPAMWAGEPGLGRFPGEGHGNPLQYSCWRIPTDRGTWWATVHGVAKSQTQLSDYAQHTELEGKTKLNLKFWLIGKCKYHE